MSAASAAIAEVEDTENLFRQNASQLIARLIGEFPLINVVSPTYLERYGAPKSPSDLSTHHAVNYASPTSGRIEDWEWTEDGAVHNLPMRPHHGQQRRSLCHLLPRRLGTDSGSRS
ncbi:hypothetical protein O3U67_13595 [Brevundimonas diminuta]|uniref:hypothetical protein n=1 Tax=Brevundimonas diminuta TaxID=293 RepID=UPI0022AFD652|nr:hypothetical protein [Brevundimonas diminuta]MCZ4109124.1 hypothetical protein [Brevundimonas diminuta]